MDTRTKLIDIEKKKLIFFIKNYIILLINE